MGEAKRRGSYKERVQQADEEAARVREATRLARIEYEESLTEKEREQMRQSRRRINQMFAWGTGILASSLNPKRN